jgi:hypothetical protein
MEFGVPLTNRPHVGVIEPGGAVDAALAAIALGDDVRTDSMSSKRNG